MKYLLYFAAFSLFLVFIGCGNKPPAIEQPNGPSVVLPSVSDTFSAIATDPDGDNVKYRFDWGDGTISEWSDLFPSGAVHKTTYAYSSQNYYNIKCQAKDEKGKSSDWSIPFHVICGLGFIKWQLPADDDFDCECNSTPAIDDQGNIYVGCVSGHIHSLKANGQERWRFNSASFDEFISSPAIAANGNIYACDRCGTIYALTSDGALIWSHFTGGEILATPAIGRNNELYVASTDGYLYAYSAQGQEMWQREIGSIGGRSSVAIDSDNHLFFGDDDGYFYSYDTAGNLRWRYEIGWEVYSSPAIMPNGKICFGAQDGYFYILNPDSTLFHRENLVYNLSSSPVIGSDSAIYITSEDGHLFRLSLNGDLDWVYPTQGYSGSSPAIVRNSFYNGDMIYFKVSWGKEKQDEDSLFMIKSDGTRFAASTIPQAMSAEFVSSPMVGQDGTVYIGGGINYDTDEGGFFALTGRGTVINNNWPLFRHDTKNTGRTQ